MVYIKKSEKLISFLKTFHEESSKSLEEISKETKNPFIELKNIEIYLSLWNTKFPDSLKYLHNMITYDDIVYTLEYRDYERDLEFNVNLAAI